MDVKIIATHDGTFHADEVCAVALLLRLFPSALVLRTRDTNLLKEADIRVDVGMRYSPPSDFDHHQNNFDLCRESGIPYSSCGLVADHFKDELFSSNEVWDKLDRSLFAPIDAQDSGMEICRPLHGCVPYDVSRMIASYRPTARSTRGMRPSDIRDVYNREFNNAVAALSDLIDREISRIEAWLQDQKIVENAINNRENPAVIIMPHYAPWQEKVKESAPEAEVIVFPDEYGGSWIAQTIPSKIGDLSPPLFPADWAGKRDKELVDVSGIETAVFCHKALFLCVAETKEGALEMADRALSK